MSSFAVEVVRLDDVLVHTNADALELAQIGGYRAVVQKGIHKKGDLVLYVPEDAVLPDDVIEAFGFTGKLAGSQKNRVKAVKLRGELSQGLVIPTFTVLGFLLNSRASQENVEKFPTLVGPDTRNDPSITIPFAVTIREGDDLSDILGIVKYEPVIPAHMHGIARPRPTWFPRYTDIENIKKYNRILVEGEEVVITEKLHGTNFGAGYKRGDEDITVSSRNLVLQRDENNLYWKAALQHSLDVALRTIVEARGAESVVLYGEVIGHNVQDLAYGFAPGQIGLRWFDLYIDGSYVSEDIAALIINQYTTRITRVPFLYRGPFSQQILEALTDGKDTLSESHVREGVVVKPTEERMSGKLGRVILKSISADYLLRKGGTERH